MVGHRSITSFGQFFWTIPYGSALVSVVTATGEIFSPENIGYIESPDNSGGIFSPNNFDIESPVNEGSIKSPKSTGGVETHGTS